MAIDNFKATLWEGALLLNFHENSIADLITTKPSNVKGDKIIFNRLGNGKLKDYEGSIAWDEITTTPIEMTFDQKKYFAIMVDDVDRVQLVKDVMKDTTAEHGALIAETVDSYVLGKMIKGAGTKLGPVSLSKNNVYDKIVDLGTALSKKKVPKSDRYVIVNAEILGLLSKDDRFTRNPEVLANGVVSNSKINGMTVISNEEVGSKEILALHKSSTGFAKQIDEVEAMRLQSSFADGVRGLVVYDSVTLRKECLASLSYTIKEEEEPVETK